MEQYTPVQEGSDVFTEQYIPWLQDLKYALQNLDDQRLGRLIKDGVPLMLFKLEDDNLFTTM
jgi:hypothetical protein